MVRSADTLKQSTRLGDFSAYFLVVLAISGLVNILALTGSFYMLQVYDRVLTSRSIPTLIALSVLAAGLFVFQGGLDVVRSQILVRLGGRLDRRLAPLAHQAVLVLPLRGASPTEATQPIRDVDTMRSFLAGQGPIAIFDLPWMPVYVAFVFLLSPVLGWVALAGMAVLVALAWIGDLAAGRLNASAVRAGMARNSLADANARNAEVLRAMGLGDSATTRFERANAAFLDSHSRASDTVGNLVGISKVLRLMLQSAMLGVGAFLAVRGDITAGAIIAASIAGTRAVAPVEAAIAHWRGFVAARQSYRSLQRTLDGLPEERDVLDLPPPRRSLKIENASVAAPSTKRVVLSGVSFELTAGQGLCIIGPSAAGKSSLARAITGVWPLTRGTIRLDDAALDRWSAAALGRHVGYLPQDVELFDGTITENIARFEDHPDSQDVLAAAAAAGVHEMILRLPEGYETRLGHAGTALSAGQRQRIALARALYRDPFLVVLDEPNSNLDALGETALTAAIQAVRARGGIAIVLSHRPNVLSAVDLVAIVNNGSVTAFGPKEEVLRNAMRPAAAA